jgi:hypothetical protein
MRWAGHLESIREMRNIYKILIGIPEEKRPLRRPRYRQEDNIKMNLREVSWEVGTGFIRLRRGTSGRLL